MNLILLRDDDLDEAVRALETGDSSTIVRPPDAVLGHLPRVDLSEHEVVRARNGQVLRLERERLQPWLPESERIRCYGPDQHLVGIARSAGTPDDWHPFRVFPPDRT